MRLKPIFWKWKRSPRVFSGWTEPDGESLKVLWATPQSVFNACGAIRDDPHTIGNVMAVAGIPKLGTTLEGVAIDLRRMPPGLKIEPAMLTGTKVCFRHPVTIFPYTQVTVGERGAVIARGRISGTVEVRLELLHIGLGEFENCVWFTPNETDEWLNAVEECE